MDVGTNGGTAYTRPSSVPSRSDTVLVNSNHYNTAGWVDLTTDPRAIQAQSTYDNLGRVTKSVADYTGAGPGASTDRTTEFGYDGSNHVLLRKADTPTSSDQTAFVYGVTTAGGSTVNSNDLLAGMEYPDKSTGVPSSSQEEFYTVNALGEQTGKSDRNGNVHAYSFDVVSRPTTDAITTAGSGVDTSVLRLETAYDTGGRPYLFTSYDAASAGNVVNQVQDTFNGLGQLTIEYQSHSGVVNTSTTPKVQYNYSEMAGGANHSRLTSMVYPNGRTVLYAYTGALDDSISRLSVMTTGANFLENYSYLGLSQVVVRSHSQIGINLTYVKQSGESNGDAGDQYTGLDRFGRIVDQRWLTVSSGLSFDRLQYGYDRNGNRLYRKNLNNVFFSELYHANGAGNGYDPFNELTDFSRGALNSSNDTISLPSRTQDWTFDALGNWSSLSTNGTAVTRTHNAQNEVTAVGSTGLSFDANGNTTLDDSGKTLIYDAWNRLVQVKSGTTVLASYHYDQRGMRITETAGSTTTDLFFSTQWQVLEEDISGTAKVQYVWSPMYVDALVERDRDADGNPANGLEERLYVQQDANWNVTAVVDHSGTIVERYAYDPYGSITYLTPTFGSRSSSTVAWRYNFQGGRFDTNTGLYNFRNRDLSPTLGRWIQVDPAGFGAGDNNLYRDVGNDPTTLRDAFGLGRDIPLGEGYTGRIDYMVRPGGVLGGHLHVYDKTGKEVAKITETGAYMERHLGKELLKPGRLPNSVRNRAGRIAKKIGRLVPIVGAGISLFFFAEDAKAEGLGKAALNQTPVLGDLIMMRNIVPEAEATAFGELNAPAMRAHQRARAALFQWTDYELKNLKCTQPDPDAIHEALQEFYSILQSKYFLEERTGRPANINKAALKFQDALKKACQGPN